MIHNVKPCLVTNISRDFFHKFCYGGRSTKRHALDITSIQGHERILINKHYGITVEDCQSNMDVGYCIM